MVICFYIYSWMLKLGGNKEVQMWLTLPIPTSPVIPNPIQTETNREKIEKTRLRLGTVSSILYQSHNRKPRQILV